MSQSYVNKGTSVIRVERGLGTEGEVFSELPLSWDFLMVGRWPKNKSELCLDFQVNWRCSKMSVTSELQHWTVTG